MPAANNIKRKKPYAQEPGAYQLVSKARILILNPGETLFFEQFITGYGKISNAKIQSYISDDVFEQGESTVRHGGKFENDGKLNIFTGWGGQEHQVSPDGFHASIVSHDDYNTYFSDVDIEDEDKNRNRVLTEAVIGHAPFEYTLKTKKAAKPGLHHIDFYFTYYNGQSWTSGKERVEFRINSPFERYSSLLSGLAATALVVTILHDGLGPLLDTAHNVGKFVNCWRHLP